MDLGAEYGLAVEVEMDHFIHNANIQHYRRLIAEANAICRATRISARCC